MGEAKANKKKIMIVDDDKEFLEELGEMLKLSGYKTILVNDSTSAYNIAAGEQPNAILLDLKMNKMNGFQVAEKLKQTQDTAKIPVIAMTGYFTEEEHIFLMRVCGIEKCLKKPFNPVDIISEIEGLRSAGGKQGGLFEKNNIAG